MIIRVKLCVVFVAAVLLLLQAGAAMAQTEWTKYSGNPVLTVGQAGDWDSKYVETGAVIFDNTTYHMWYSGYDGAHWRIGYAYSSDGITWTKSEANPVFAPGPAGSWDDYGVFCPSVVYDGSKFHLWYTGFGTINQIGHATSDNGTAWTRDSANPVLRADAGSLSWDGSAYGASVVQAPEGYKMWYVGYRARSSSTLVNTSTIGYADSPDGTVWTKHDDNPVLVPGDKGSWDDVDTVYPSVVFDGSTYHLWYAAWHRDFKLLDKGFYRLGYATSADGLAWNKYEGNPVLQPGKRLFTGWDGRGISYPAVILHGSQFQMWYDGEGRWGKAHRKEIGYATSPVDAQ